jgi:hypothetical protein
MSEPSMHKEVAALFKQKQIEQKQQFDSITLTLDEQDFILAKLLEFDDELCEEALDILGDADDAFQGVAEAISKLREKLGRRA